MNQPGAEVASGNAQFSRVRYRWIERWCPSASDADRIELVSNLIHGDDTMR